MLRGRLHMDLATLDPGNIAVSLASRASLFCLRIAIPLDAPYKMRWLEL